MDFDSNASGWMSSMASGGESTMNIANTSETNDSFLSRPVKIATFAWDTGIGLNEAFDPWSLFFENKKVINRLAHFKNLKSDLCVKFLINGNPFYYGKLIAFYTPLHKVDNYQRFRPTIPEDLIAASQQPHIYIDPTSSEGGELCLPFIYPKNTLDIPKSEWSKMGVVTLTVLNPLQHANNSNERLNVTVFAYAKNYELSTPTSSLPSTIVPQMAITEEYGRVSGPAHTLANWSGKLADAPYIGPYARATQMIASAVGGVAELFGFARPRIPAVTPNYAYTGIQLASTNTQDASMMLSLDAKKEITIDPRVTGAAPIDEMALVPLACKESYLTQFTWGRGDTPDKHLFSVRVRPTQGAVETGTPTNLHMTPSAWCTLPFEYWTGSMEFRLQVVASAFHRGRLRIVWDPDVYSGDDFNVAYTQIMDISTFKEAKVRVGWGQNTSYLPVGPNLPDLGGNFNPFFPSFSTTPYTTIEPFSNGVLSVYVLNELTAPSEDIPDVFVNVFTNACDDFEVNSPIATYIDNLSPLPAANSPTFTVPPLDAGGPKPPLEGLPPTVPDEGDDFTEPLALKTVNPLGVLFGLSTGSARDINMPQFSNLIGISTDRAPLINNNEDYQLFFRPSGSVNPQFITFSFENASANSRDITVTVNGIGATGTLAASIGATIDIDVPVNFPATGEFVPVNIEVLGSGGRIILQTVQTVLGISETVKLWQASELASDNAGLTLNGDFAEGADNTNVTIGYPSQTTNGTYGTYVAINNTALNGVSYNSTVTASLTSAYCYPFNWQGAGVEVSAPLSPTLTPWKAQVYAIYSVIDTAAPQMEIYPEMDTTPEDSGEMIADDANAPEIETPTLYMGPSCVSGPSNQVFFGEQVSSWRQVLKRFVSEYTLTVVPNARTSVEFPIYPIGSAPGSTQASTRSLFNWVTTAYVSIRGSYRLKVISNRSIRTAAFTRAPAHNVPDGGSVSVNDFRSSCAGSAFSYANLNGCAEVEIPWYSRYRFLPGRTTQNSNPSEFIEREWVTFYGTTTPDETALIHVAYAAGEDFSVSQFLAVPVMVIG